MDVDIEIESIKPERTEIFDFKRKSSQEKFNHLTSETSKFTKCFETNASLHDQVENWRKVFLLKHFQKYA